MHVVQGGDNSIAQAVRDIGDAKFEYEYPNRLDLKPGSDLHDKIVKEVLARARESHEAMSSRYSSWRNIDKVNTTYQFVDDDEEKIKEKDSRKPVSIIFPYTYAIKETLLTYLTIAFFQDPMFIYEGVSPDDIPGSSLMTLLVRMHCSRNKIPLTLHTMFNDCLSYGISPVSPGWTRRYGTEIKQVMGDLYDIDGVKVAGTPTSEGRRAIMFEGNDLHNIDPYRYLPDPNVASHKIQDGEYAGWWYGTSLNSLLGDEAGDSSMFNVKYLKLLKNRKSFLNADESARNYKQKKVDLSSSLYTSKVDAIPMFIDIIPSDWGLGDGEYPEKWWFEVAADAILIRAEKMTHNHGKYPIAVACPDFDGYSPTPLSRLESLYGLQHTMDWLFNSHIANVRKALNDMIVYDPWMINSNDVKDPKAGKLIRTRRPSWGKGKVSDYIQQLNVVDVTRGNIADSSYIADWMQRLSAADDSMMGFMRSGGPERLTKAEYQGTKGGGVSRLERLARTISLQAMHDIGFFFASHAQQYSTRETYSKIVGDLPERLMQEAAGNQGRVKIRPQDLHIEYDILIRDGSIPGGNFSEAWLELFNTVATDQELRQMFDVPRIFTYIARELGAKNVDDFKRNLGQINPTTMPDEEVDKQIDKGNIIPMEGRV